MPPAWRFWRFWRFWRLAPCLPSTRLAPLARNRNLHRPTGHLQKYALYGREKGGGGRNGLILYRKDLHSLLELRGLVLRRPQDRIMRHCRSGRCPAVSRFWLVIGLFGVSASASLVGADRDPPAPGDKLKPRWTDRS
jgi:hypothetical protein